MSIHRVIVWGLILVGPFLQAGSLSAQAEPRIQGPEPSWEYGLAAGLADSRFDRGRFAAPAVAVWAQRGITSWTALGAELGLTDDRFDTTCRLESRETGPCELGEVRPDLGLRARLGPRTSFLVVRIGVEGTGLTPFLELGSGLDLPVIGPWRAGAEARARGTLPKDRIRGSLFLRMTYEGR